MFWADDSTSSPNASGRTVAIIELWLRGDASPATYRGCEQFLTACASWRPTITRSTSCAACGNDEHHHAELLELGRLVHSN